MAGRPRRSDGDLWILLLVIVLALGGLTAASSAYRVVVTVGYLGGIARSWYAAYNGSQYYALWQQAAPQLAAIAAQVKAGRQEAARVALEQWLLAFDPLGLVWDDVQRGKIVDSFLFEEK